MHDTAQTISLTTQCTTSDPPGRPHQLPVNHRRASARHHGPDPPPRVQQGQLQASTALGVQVCDVRLLEEPKKRGQGVKVTSSLVSASSVNLHYFTMWSVCLRFMTSWASQRLKDFMTRFSFTVNIVSHIAVNCYIDIHGIIQSIHSFFLIECREIVTGLWEQQILYFLSLFRQSMEIATLGIVAISTTLKTYASKINCLP